MIPYSNSYSAKITVELRDIVASGLNIWDFDYPSYYQGEKKTAFEKKVIDHYYFRQIGQETVERWLHYFRTRVREIMPYYNRLYELQELFDAIEDPFEAYNLLEEYTRTLSDKGKVTGTGSASGTVNVTSNGQTSENGKTSREDHTEFTAQDTSKRKFSDTPQGSIQNVTDGYLTDYTETTDGKDQDTTVTSDGEDERTSSSTDTGVTESESSTSNESNTENTTTETYTLSKRGNIGVQPLGDEIKKLRDSIIDIDMQIIEELADLFLMIY